MIESQGFANKGSISCYADSIFVAMFSHIKSPFIQFLSNKNQKEIQTLNTALSDDSKLDSGVFEEIKKSFCGYIFQDELGLSDKLIEEFEKVLNSEGEQDSSEFLNFILKHIPRDCYETPDNTFEETKNSNKLVNIGLKYVRTDTNGDQIITKQSTYTNIFDLFGKTINQVCSKNFEATTEVENKSIEVFSYYKIVPMYNILIFNSVLYENIITKVENQIISRIVKINNKDIPYKLTLNGFEYFLSSVVCHMGNVNKTSSSGHYVCLLKNGDDYYRYNDSLAKELRMKKINEGDFKKGMEEYGKLFFYYRFI
jgi:ubiquitin C-terminal hydrolase